MPIETRGAVESGIFDLSDKEAGPYSTVSVQLKLPLSLVLPICQTATVSVMIRNPTLS